MSLMLTMPIRYYMRTKYPVGKLGDESQLRVHPTIGLNLASKSAANALIAVIAV